MIRQLVTLLILTASPIVLAQNAPPPVQAALSPPSKSIKWLSLADGLKAAKESSKPLLVDFYFGEECRRCDALEKGPYADSQVIDRIAHDAVSVRIDLKRELSAEEKKLGEANDYKEDCLLVVLGPDGKTLLDRDGKAMRYSEPLDKETLLKRLDDAITRLKRVQKN